MPEPGAGGPGPAPTPFGDRLKAAVARRESQIVLGLDPDPARLWPAAAPAASGRARRGGRARGVGPLPARDRGRRPGVRRRQAAARLLRAPRRARAGRRWPRSSRPPARTACSCSRTASAATCRSPPPPTRRRSWGRPPRPAARSRGLGADALTANPLLGADSLEPLIAGARARGGGVFALVRTSNPGAGDLHGPRARRRRPAVGAPRAPRRLARRARAGVRARGRRRGHGGHRPRAPRAHARADARRRPSCCRASARRAGDVRALAPAFAPDRAAGLVTASRSIVGAYETAGGEPADAALRGGRAPARTGVVARLTRPGGRRAGL